MQENKRSDVSEEVSESELARYGAGVCTVGDQLYLWRGDTDDDSGIDVSKSNQSHVNVIYTLNLNNSRWRRIHTDWDNSSEMPEGRCSMAVCVINDVMYTYGGWHCEYPFDSRSNKLHGLCLRSMIWREIIAVNPQDGPGKKDKCGMVEHAGKLCIFGGYGYVTDHQEMNRLYSREPTGGFRFLCWTNELHLFDPITSEYVRGCASSALYPPLHCSIWLLGGDITKIITSIFYSILFVYLKQLYI